MYHNWPVIFAQAAKVVRDCDSLAALATMLEIPRSTLQSAFNRDGISFEEFKAQATSTKDEFHGVDASKVVRILRKAPQTREQLSGVLDRSEQTVDAIINDMIEAGYSIERQQERYMVPAKPVLDTDLPHLFAPQAASQNITFGIASDTHVGSKAEQPTALNDFCRIAHDEYGVRHFLHPGDLLAGFGVYRGQAMDLYETSGVGQARAAIHNLPYFSDSHWWILGGNHDYSFYKTAGLDARREMLQDHPDHGLAAREDITLLPYDACDLPLLSGIHAHLWHPAGGIPYAYSYRGQRAADQLAFDELMKVTVGDKPKPTLRFLLIGHMHVMYSFFAGPIFVLGCGCFEGRNSFLLRKGLVPHIGGWIIQCQFIDTFLHRVSPTAIRYREVADDWRHWNAERLAKGREVIEYAPIFSWTGEER